MGWGLLHSERLWPFTTGKAIELSPAQHRPAPHSICRSSSPCSLTPAMANVTLLTSQWVVTYLNYLMETLFRLGRKEITFIFLLVKWSFPLMADPYLFYRPASIWCRAVMHRLSRSWSAVICIASSLPSAFPQDMPFGPEPEYWIQGLTYSK